MKEALDVEKTRDAPVSDTQDIDEVKELRLEVTRLNNHKFLRVYNSLPRLLAFNFARGLAFGLGTVVGASILVSILAFSLRGIDFIPIIGDWASEIAQQIETAVD